MTVHSIVPAQNGYIAHLIGQPPLIALSLTELANHLEPTEPFSVDEGLLLKARGHFAGGQSVAAALALRQAFKGRLDLKSCLAVMRSRKADPLVTFWRISK